ncbi:MAG TPA: hypothetical protein VMB34_05785 [Acetobacteraceae bacterium]|nr:hypothetical protein [Acetobacteraceae bacterium]
MRLRPAGLVVLMGLAGVPAARADQVADEIAKATAAWQAHDSQGTLAALNAAGNLLRQARAEALETLLPVPLPGWAADPAKTSAVGMEMLGGGISASRTYHDGSQQVDVEITADSPMLLNMATLLSSPYAQAAGVKTVTIGSHNASYTANDNTYMALIADKIIVKVAGNKDTPEATLRTYVTAIDFDRAASMAK